MTAFDKILKFMRTVDQRVGYCLRWHKFKLVVSPEMYESIRQTHAALLHPIPDGGEQFCFGHELVVDEKASDDFAFVLEGVKLAPAANAPRAANPYKSHD